MCLKHVLHAHIIKIIILGGSDAAHKKFHELPKKSRRINIQKNIAEKKMFGGRSIIPLSVCFQYEQWISRGVNPFVKKLNGIALS